MPTNRPSQWSTLKAQLEAFASELDDILIDEHHRQQYAADDPNDRHSSDARTALEFIKEQEERLWLINQNLLRVSDVISNNTSTASSSSRRNSSSIGNGRTSFASATTTTPTTQQAAKCLGRWQELQRRQITQLLQQQQQHYTIHIPNLPIFHHHPLGPIGEVEYETDASQTPRSTSALMGSSPHYFSSTSSSSSSSSSGGGRYENQQQQQYLLSHSGGTRRSTRSPTRTQFQSSLVDENNNKDYDDYYGEKDDENDIDRVYATTLPQFRHHNNLLDANLSPDGTDSSSIVDQSVDGGNKRVQRAGSLDGHRRLDNRNYHASIRGDCNQDNSKAVTEEHRFPLSDPRRSVQEHDDNNTNDGHSWRASIGSTTNRQQPVTQLQYNVSDVNESHAAGSEDSDDGADFSLTDYSVATKVNPKCEAAKRAALQQGTTKQQDHGVEDGVTQYQDGEFSVTEHSAATQINPDCVAAKVAAGIHRRQASEEDGGDSQSVDGDFSMTEDTVATKVNPKCASAKRNASIYRRHTATDDHGDDDNDDEFSEYSALSAAPTIVNPKRAQELKALLARHTAEDDQCSTKTAQTKVNPKCAAEQAAWRMERDNGTDAVEKIDANSPGVSTKVNEDRAAAQPLADNHSSTRSRQHFQEEDSPLSHRSRPNNIEFDAGAFESGLCDPVGTSITFDMSMDDATINTNLNDTLGQPLETVLEESVGTSHNNSIRSTETPVLDRYRLVDDDESPHGFTVLPNERGKHNAASSFRQATAAAPQFASPDAPADSTMPRKVYRKTPLPRPKPEKSPRSLPSGSDLDENAPMEDSTTSLEMSATSIRDSVQHQEQHQQEVGSQPRRKPLSEGNRRGGLAERLLALDHRDRRSLAPSLLSDNNNQTNATPPASRLFRKKPSTPSHSSGKVPSKLSAPGSHLPFLRPVTESEFAAAPRIVRMQVDFSQVDTAITTLNDAIRRAIRSAQPVKHVHVAESEVHRIWQASVAVAEEKDWDERKRKSLLFALCHFQRLLLRRPASVDQETVYDVVG